MSRAKHLFGRFGTLQEQLDNKPVRGMERVNRVGRDIQEQEIQEEEGDNPLGILDKVLGAGIAEGHRKVPTYAEHGPDYVRFAGMGQGGQPFIAVGPRLSISDGVAWVNRRISGFSANPKARESMEEAVRRKCIAAHGEDFVRAVGAKGGEKVKMELDMMMSPDAHSGIADLGLMEKRGDKVNITIDKDGTINGISFGIMNGSEGQIYATADMLNNTIAGGRDVK